MDRDVERLIEHTGVAVPLAARILSLIADSGASHVEASAALQVVHVLMARLPISYQGEELGDRPEAPELPSHN